MGFLHRHLPALLFGASILLLTGSTGSAEATGSWAEPLLRWIGLPEGLVELVHRGLRKLGHFMAYAVFAWLALRSIRGDRDTTPLDRWLAFGAAVLLAIADEALQARSANRGASVLDVVIDGSGAATMLGFLLPQAERLLGRRV